MLRYSLKPITETELSTFPFEDFYVAPNVSYISGVTDYNVGLINTEKVLIKSPYIENGSESNELIVGEALRQGRLEVEVELKVKTITKTLNFNVYNNEVGETDADGGMYIIAYNRQIEIPNELAEKYSIYSAVTQNYVVYNGDISYFFSGSTPDNSGYVVDNKFYKASKEDDTIRIKTYLYIDDGKLEVGENVYYADFSKLPTNPSLKPELRLSRYVAPISGGNYLGDIDDLSYYAASAPDNRSLVIDKYTQADWRRIYKFRIIKKGDPYLAIDDMLYGRYRHYITIDGKNYYFKEVVLNNKSLEYGVLVNKQFYTDEALEGVEGIVNDKFKEDLKSDYKRGVELANRYVKIPEYNRSFQVKNSLVSSTNSGEFLIIILKSEKLDIIPGDTINAVSNVVFSIKKEVQEDENGTWYVEYLGKKYEVEKKAYDMVSLSDKEYKLTYTDDSYTAATTTVNGDKIRLLVKYFLTDDCSSEVTYAEYEQSTLDTKNVKAMIDKKVYYKEQDGTPIIIRLDMHSNAYRVTENSGITIGDTVYKVRDYDDGYNKLGETTDKDVEESANQYYIYLSDRYSFKLNVSRVMGSSTLICYPEIDNNLYSNKDIIDIRREIINIIMDNKEHFYFTLSKDTFGREIMNAENGLAMSMSSRIPYSTSENNLLEKSIQIYRQNGYLSFKLPLTVNVANNLMREDTITNEFVEYHKERSINRIVDMEKDIYSPVWKNGNEYNPIKEIRFNLHFRTRDLDTWKVIEDDREYTTDPFNEYGEFYTPNSRMCNWFVTDYNFYKNAEGDYDVDKSYLQNASDLLGYLNFTTNEVITRASKIGKSFLRLSFYSTNNPQTQVLLGTSTVFFDENLAFAKYLSLKKSSELNFIDTVVMQDAGYAKFEDYLTDVAAGTDKYQVSANTTTTTSELTGDNFLNDSFRLSSRFTIQDKYNCDTSSEGYYLYMFKEYTRKNREGVVFMKVEFNHAGIGQSIPFLLPRKVEDENGVGIPYYLHKDADVKELKKGFKLEDIYKQLYLPVYVIFDTNTNKYVYYLDDKLRENAELNVDNEIMEFNLFEVKFENESLRGEDESN